MKLEERLFSAEEVAERLRGISQGGTHPFGQPHSRARGGPGG
jgi:hypothetical protein